MSIYYYILQLTGWGENKSKIVKEKLIKADIEQARKTAQRMKKSAEKSGLGYVRVAVFQVHEYAYVGSIRDDGDSVSADDIYEAQKQSERLHRRYQRKDW